MFIPVVKPIVRTILRIVSILIFILTIFAAYGGRFTPDFFTLPSILCLTAPYLAVATLIISILWFIGGKWITGGLGILSLVASWSALAAITPLGFLERSNSAMMRSVHESEKAAYYARKADAVENNNNIYIGDDDAIERLEEKIATLTAKQEKMRAVNKLMRSKKSDDEKFAGLLELGFSEIAAKNAVANNSTYPAYCLTNNNAKINAAKKQLEKAKSLAGKEDRE